jgi:hypothetical protein
MIGLNIIHGNVVNRASIRIDQAFTHLRICRLQCNSGLLNALRATSQPLASSTISNDQLRLTSNFPSRGIPRLGKGGWTQPGPVGKVEDSASINYQVELLQAIRICLLWHINPMARVGNIGGRSCGSAVNPVIADALHS